MIELYDYQEKAVQQMKNGCILCGGVGSGKSRTALAYYFTENGGELYGEDFYIPMCDPPQDLYIITTARKRDDLEWEGELCPFLLSTKRSASLYSNKVVIDSWNNISKYTQVRKAFFIFDEQRVIGSGAWVKAFLKITQENNWILLSATPGDTWMDYIPVFVANGFYKNRTEFIREHVVFNRSSKYPKVDRYLNTGRLIRLRDKILVDMDFKRQTTSHHEDVFVKYDISKYKDAIRTRTNPYIRGYVPCKENDPYGLQVGKDIPVSEVASNILPGVGYEPEDGDYVKIVNQPIKQASGLCYVLRRIVNSDESRQKALLELFEKHSRLIVFYNFDYELDILKGLDYGDEASIAEWNGHKHQPVPESKSWVYFVQYTAGAEGWNCVKTDTIVFYSQNYSYKIMEQAAGRIDRLNTPYSDLYYYHLKSRSGIDLAISKALSQKKKFNERKFVKW